MNCIVINLYLHMKVPIQKISMSIFEGNCLQMRVEGRWSVGTQRNTWVRNVEADMAELEIDREDVYDREKWRIML